MAAPLVSPSRAPRGVPRQRPSARPSGGARAPLRTGHAEVAVTVAVLLAAVLLVVPLPAAVLDVVLGANLTLALLLVVLALEARDPQALSSLPTLLLVGSLFRSASSVAATRLVLGRGEAGTVIAAFGRLVAGGDVLVGGVVFLVLALVQALVIAKGAERVAEVAARFTLDALPGKQLAIDADLRAGAIDRAEAERRREALGVTSHFYGAMDGALKFVRGDAVAGLAILAVNVVGGLAIGIVRRGSTFGHALETYTLLTIGEGLAAQIPALLTATAAGIAVTRVQHDAAPGSFGGALVEQVLQHPRGLRIAAVGLGALALTPGLPAAPFALASGGLALVAWRADARRAHAQESTTAELRLVLGTALAAALRAETRAGGGTERALALATQRLADELGMRWPSTAVAEATDPAPGVPRDPWSLELQLHGARLADERVEPALGTDAPTGVTDRVAATLLAMGLAHAAELLGVEETHRLVGAWAETHPGLVRDVVPKLVSVLELNAVLRELVSEGVSLRAFPEILTALAACPATERKPERLTARVRLALARQLTLAHATPEGVLETIFLSPLLEDTLTESLRGLDGEGRLALEPELARDIVGAIGRALDEARRARAGHPVVVTTGALRRHVRELVRSLPEPPPVLACEELLPQTPLNPVARATPGNDALPRMA